MKGEGATPLSGEEPSSLLNHRRRPAQAALFIFERRAMIQT